MVIPILALLVLGIIVVTSGAAPWLFAAVVAYFGFRVLRRPRRQRWIYAGAGPLGASGVIAPPRPAARPSLAGANRLPRALQAQVRQITEQAQWLLQYRDLFPEGSEERYLVETTLGDYLPATVAAFLAVPPAMADKPPASNGKTAVQELKCQLDILQAKLDQLAGRVHRHSVDRLVANGRFLEERMADRKSELDLPVS